MSRRGKIQAAVVSLAVAMVVLIPLCLRWQAQWHLSAYRKKLIASGEKLTVAELSPKRNWQATNTEWFVKLASALPPLWDNAPAAMRSIKPGVARVVWRQPRCLERLDNSKTPIDVWPGFTEAVRTNETAIRKVQSLLDNRGVEFINEWNHDLYEHSYLHSVMYLVVDLGGSAILALHEGRMGDADHYLNSSGAIIQLAAKDTTITEQLANYSILSIEVGDLWEALQASAWTDEQLAEWQHQWGQASILAAAEASLAMERVRGFMVFQVVRNSKQELAGMLGGDSGIKDNFEIIDDLLHKTRKGAGEVLTSYPRYWGWRWIWSYRDEQHYLEIMQTAIEATRNAQKRRAVLFTLKDMKTAVASFSSKTTKFDISGALAGNNEAFVSQTLKAQTIANMATTAIALDRFRLTNHAYPDDLARLTPGFVRTVPVDCMDGHDLRYRLNPDGTYLLYSVGDDGVDNGGDPTPKEGKGLFFLFGRDWVWPRPATAEELQAYEAEQSKPTRRK